MHQHLLAKGCDSPRSLEDVDLVPMVLPQTFVVVAVLVAAVAVVLAVDVAVAAAAVAALVAAHVVLLAAMGCRRAKTVVAVVAAMEM